jgi:predicted dehydrogenase
VVYDLMVHDLDLFGVLAGFGEVADLRANGLGVATSGPDIAHARVELVDGRVAVLSTSRISPVTSRKFRAFGRGAYVGLDLGAKSGRAVDATLADAALRVEAGDALRAELEAFLRFVVDGALDAEHAGGAGAGRLATLDEALWTLRLAERIRCASA